MGWREFFRKTFEREVRENRSWGEMQPVKLVFDGEEHYTVGCMSSAPATRFSPRIQHPQGVRTRIVVRYFFFAQQGATGRGAIAVVFYKDGDTAKDPDGHDLHGAAHTLSAAPETNFAEPHEFVVECDGGRIRYGVDGRTLSEVALEQPLASFAIVAMVEEASGGDVGILIREVVAEYYDFWEDVMGMLVGAVQWMVPVMLVIMVVVLVVSVLRGRGGRVARG